MDFCLLLCDLLSQCSLLLHLGSCFFLELLCHVLFESTHLFSFLIRGDFGLGRRFLPLLRLGFLLVKLPLLIHPNLLRDLELLLFLPKNLHVFRLLHVLLRFHLDILFRLRLIFHLDQFHGLLMLDILEVEELFQVLLAFLADELLVDDLL